LPVKPVNMEPSDDADNFLSLRVVGRKRSPIYNNSETPRLNTDF